MLIEENFFVLYFEDIVEEDSMRVEQSNIRTLDYGFCPHLDLTAQPS